MPVNTRHANYRTKKYELMRACLEGDEAVKALNTLVIPKPSGIVANENSSLPADKTRAAEDWKNYKFRADYPDLLGATMDGLVGLAFNKPWTIELPRRLEYMLEKATPDGKTLEQLIEHLVRESLLTARTGLFSDKSAGEDPYIAVYQAETITNWRNSPATLIVLCEAVEVEQQDRFKTETRTDYRELTLEDGRYVVRYHEHRVAQGNDGAGGYVTDDVKIDLQVGEIPFVFVGSQNLDSEPDKFIPLWPMAKKLLKAMEISADYYQALHMTAQPTLFLKGFGDNVPNIAGASVTIHSDDEKADAKYVEFSGAGNDAMHKEIQRQIEGAMLFAHYLNEKGSVESGSALGIRVAAKTATLKAVITNVAFALEKSLGYCAQWINAEVDDISIEPNLSFADTDVDSALIKAYSESTKIPDEILFEYLRKVKATTLEDEELAQLNEEAAEKADARLLQMDQNAFGPDDDEDDDDQAAA